MFYRAFKHHLQNRFKDQYSIANLTISALFSNVIAMASQPLFFAITDRYLVNYDNLPWMLGGYLMLMVTTPGILGLLKALFYCLKFYGNFEVIDMAFGYRAFRLNREQQEYLGLYYERRQKKEERIIAVANLHRDGTIWAVMNPGRHHHCHWFIHENGGSDRTLQEMGFLTNRYRFIGREEARDMAMVNGQVPNPDHSRDLFSEDLWDTPKHLQYKG